MLYNSTSCKFSCKYKDLHPLILPCRIFFSLLKSIDSSYLWYSLESRWECIDTSVNQCKIIFQLYKQSDYALHYRLLYMCICIYKHILCSILYIMCMFTYTYLCICIYTFTNIKISNGSPEIYSPEEKMTLLIWL